MNPGIPINLNPGKRKLCWNSIYFFEGHLDIETADVEFLKQFSLEGWKLALFEDYPDVGEEYNWKGFIRSKDSFLCVSKRIVGLNDQDTINEAVHKELHANISPGKQKEFLRKMVEEDLKSLNVPEGHPLWDFDVFVNDSSRFESDSIRRSLHTAGGLLSYKETEDEDDKTQSD